MRSQDRFCGACGKAFVPEARAAASPPQAIGHSRVPLLGVLMIVYAAIMLVPGTFLSAMPLFRPQLGRAMFHPTFISFPGMLIPAIGGFVLIAGACGIIAGIGLLHHKPWARVLAILFACLMLFDFPLGTALGVFALWTLAAAGSEQWFRAQPARR